VRLSVVLPVYNEPDGVAETVATVAAALAAAPALAPAEFVIADDGSTVDVAGPARAAAGDVPVRVARLDRNSGRFEARRHGLEAAAGDLVLFVDAGIELEPGSLAFLAPRIADGRSVWNGDVLIDAGANPFALFWKAVCALAFAIYLDDPRETSFGIEEFEPFPKGTGCFLAPRALLLESFAAFRSVYGDTRFANDDGPIIRYIAERRRINIAPGFRCVYRPRRNLRSFVRHAFHRGSVFVDGHGHRESRFFPAVIAFFPASIVLALATARRPAVAPVTAVATIAATATVGIAKRRPPREVAALAGLMPVYLAAHGVGMWRGLALAVQARARSWRA